VLLPAPAGPSIAIISLRGGVSLIFESDCTRQLFGTKPKLDRWNSELPARSG
jgi:hypothetical protein